MKHLDLFSGIGGFALAAREVWGEEHEVVGFCDNDRFCQNVLAKNFPGTRIHGDIRELTAQRIHADADRRGRWEGGQRGPMDEVHPAASDERLQAPQLHPHGIDLLTGGFPCQPFSHAGKRKGTEDSRHLWPEMCRVIREVRPRWVIGENVRGLLSQEGGMVFETVCADLESLGYEVWPFVLPACGVGAPHRRDRVWIVARRQNTGNDSESGGRGVCDSEDEWKTGSSLDASIVSGGEPRPHPSDHGHELTGDSRERRAGFADSSGDATDAEGEQNRRIQQPGVQPNSFDRRDWNRDWREVATATCVRRMDDGVPSHVYGPDRISEAAHRRERLKALGNAIVPAVAVEIMRAIRYIDDMEGSW